MLRKLDYIYSPSIAGFKLFKEFFRGLPHTVK